MGALDRYNELMRKRMEWQAVYDQCQECIEDVELEFRGENSRIGYYDACAASRAMREVYLNRENFWKGPDSTAFGFKLNELHNELGNCETMIVDALNEIAADVERVCLEINQEMNACREEFNMAEKALFAVDDLHKVKRKR